MTTSSVSFRITRHTEDLAQTIHALSQRVVQLEQRLAALESHVETAQEETPSAEHLTSLANVDQLLRDCRELLSTATPVAIHSVDGERIGDSEILDGLDAAA